MTHIDTQESPNHWEFTFELTEAQTESLSEARLSDYFLEFDLTFEELTVCVYKDEPDESPNSARDCVERMIARCM